jgi:ribosomal protein S18 acetylase RimI-like enzyme
MLIRLIRTSECEKLGRITVEAYRELFDEEPLGDYENELLNVGARRLDSEVYVALNGGGALMGGVTYVPNAESSMSEFDDPEGAGIRMLAVKPRYQGMGAGRALVETCIARARFQNRRRVVLHSTPVMTTARTLYQRMGFEAFPEMDIWFNDSPSGDGEAFHLIAYVLTL